MKIKWGALVVDGRNKVGGHVASKNRAGPYLRTKVTPVNPRTTFQVNVRNRLAGLSSAWRALTAGQRTAWNAAVADFARTDIFGDLRNPSGFNLHQKLNNYLLNISESVITSPPLPVAVDAFATFSFSAVAGTGSMLCHFTPDVQDDHKVLVLATPELSPGISFVKAEFRQIAVLPASQATGYDAGPAFAAKFGAGLTLGMKIFIRLVQVVMATGQAGIPIQASFVVIQA